ncbi:hypothetical protein AGMMS49983_20630 [Clostridia bacterium]|nr:hypothetical protein AGMMS49983_20630 [Clostridia bacterium]
MNVNLNTMHLNIAIADLRKQKSMLGWIALTLCVALIVIGKVNHMKFDINKHDPNEWWWKYWLAPIVHYSKTEMETRLKHIVKNEPSEMPRPFGHDNRIYIMPLGGV